MGRVMLEPKTLICSTCNKEYVPTRMQRYHVRHNKTNRHFCSKKCLCIGRTGAGNPKWRGGKTESNDGYLYIYRPNHPHANKDGCVFEHRLIMEQCLGRYLLPSESIHHIDGDKKNNLIDNLKLFETEGKHRSFHIKFRNRSPRGFLVAGGTLQKGVNNV